MNSDNQGQNNLSTEWIPLSEAAQFTPYSADYLSLLARKRRLTAKKVDGIWYTTKGIINNYLTQQAKRAEALNQSTDNYLPFIAGSENSVPEYLSEPPSTNVRYSRTYAEDVQKIRGVVNEGQAEIKSTAVPETPMVTLSPVLVNPQEKKQAVPTIGTAPTAESVSMAADKVEITSTVKREMSAPAVRAVEVQERVIPKVVGSELSADKSISGDVLMEEFMRRFNAQIDRQVDSQHGFLFKIGRFIRRSYGYTLRSPKRLPLFIACLLLVVILPFRFVSGFADNFLADTLHAVKNAQTVMGFRPGTHENEILLLGPEGEIAIFGNVETEGQFRSYVEDGVAPITVKSTTKVENLNADMLDGVSGHEFTLAYVTKNGNVTHEPVFLEGTVEVGQTLLVKGATKLLNSLEVDGNLSVFGEANFAKGISVSGPAIFKDILTAPSVIVSGLLRAHKLIVEEDSIFEGLVTIKDDLDVEGSITASSGRIKGSFRVEEGFHAMQNVSLGSDAYTVRVTSAEWSVDNDGNAVFANVTGEDGDFSNLSVGGNVSASTFTATNPNATSTFEGALSVGTTTSYEMLTLDGALYLASIAAPAATSSRLHNQDGTLYWAGSAFAGPSLGTWSTDGTNVWRTTGNVGIGTSSPNVRLHVDGGDVRFNSTGGGPGLYFDESTGRLGLGTTTPDSLLTVAGTTNITGATTLGSTLNVIGNTTLTSASTTNLTVSTNSYLGTVLSGTWNGSTVSVPYGGTGATSLTGLLLGNGTSAFTATTTLSSSYIEDAYVRNIGDTMTGNLVMGGTSANIALGSNYLSGDGDDEGVFVDSSGKVGIGTTTPTQLFSVDGNTYITGGLGIGIATTSSGVLETTGSARIGGSLAVVGTTTTDKLAVNSYVISDLIPEVNAFYNLGSSARYWNDAYIDTLTVNNISAASTSISGTQSESFTINSDNATADTENMDLVFYRGTVVPNALISWDAVRDRFDINQPFFIQNDSSTTTVVTLDVHGTAGQTTDIFRVASSTGTSFLNVTAGGNVGIGTTTPGSLLTVAGTTNITGAATLGSTLTVIGNTTLTSASTTNLTVSTNSYLGTILSGTWNGTAIGANYGGTGQTTYATGDLLYASAVNTLSKRTIGSAGNVLMVSGGIPTWTATSSLGLDAGFFAQGGNSFGTTATLGTNDSNNLVFETGGTTKLTIDTSGNVGIGTSTPSNNLHIANTADAAIFLQADTDNTTESDNPFIKLSQDGGAVQGIFGLVGDAGRDPEHVLYTDTLGNSLLIGGQTTFEAIQFGTNDAVRMTVANSGNVGIGTTTPSQMLSVGATTGSQFLVTSAGAVTDGSWTADVIADDYGGTGQSTYSTGDMLYASGANTLAKRTIGSTGDILTVSGGVPTWAATSTLGFTTASDFDTCAEFAAIMTGETGTCGSVVLSASPTFTGTITATAATLSSTLTMSGTAANIALGSNYLSGDGGDEGIFVDSSGNVGIGTSTPGYLLDVGAGLSSTLAIARINGGNSGSNSGAALFLGNAGTTNNAIGNYSAIYGGAYNNALTLYGAGQNILIPSGNVGIGTTGPGKRLTVYDTGSDIQLELGYADTFSWQLGRVGSDGRLQFTGRNGGSTVTGPTFTLGGNVGIGTTTPEVGLSIAGSDAYGLLHLTNSSANGTASVSFKSADDTNGSAGNWLIGKNLGGLTSDQFSIWQGTAGNRLTIDTSGNVGIGTTTPASNLVVSTTVAGAGIRVDGTGSINPTVRVDLNSVQYGTFTVAGAAGQGLPTSVLGDVVLKNAQAYALIFGTNNTEYMRISSTGNVGIGTTSPAYKLQVSGDVAIGNASGLIWADSTGTFGNQITRQTSDGSMKLTSGQANILLMPTSNVGIGTTTPATKLTIAPGAAYAAPTLGTASGAFSMLGDNGRYGLYSGVSSSGNTWLQAMRNDATATAYDILLNPSGGNVGIGTTAPTQKLTVLVDGSLNTTGDSIVNGVGIVGSNQNFGTAGNPALFNVMSNSTLGADVGATIGMGGRYTSTAYAQFAIIKAAKENATDGNFATYLGFGTRAHGGQITEKLRITSAGNVGIGNTTPASKLTVGTEVADDNAFSYDSNSLMVVHQTPTATATLNDPKTVLMLARQGTSGQAYGAAAAFNVSRYENSSTNSRTRLDISLAHTTFDVTSNNIMTLLSSGNVGIGTTAPRTKLDIVSSGTANTSGDVPGGFVLTGPSSGVGGYTGQLFVQSNDAQAANKGGSIALGGRYVDASTIGAYFAAIQGAKENSTSGNLAGYLALRTRSAGNLDTEHMRITSAGNVGIGTSAPGAKLDVLSTTEQLRLSYNSSVYWSDAIASDGGRTLTGFGSDGDLNIIFTGATDGDFSINTDDLFVDTSAACVAIGSTSCASTLSVTGGISLTGALDTSGSVGTYGSLTVDGSKNGYSGFEFEDVAGGGHYLMVHNSADIQGFLSSGGTWSWYFSGGVLSAGTVPAARITAGAGSGLDADLLDGISSASFLRSDTTTTFSGGVLTATTATGADVTTSAGINGLQVLQNTPGADAIMTFHVGGDFAVNFGLDGDTNDLTVGGWSMGVVKYKIWHEGNDGAGSTLNADLLDGISSASFLQATSIDTSAELAAILTDETGTGSAVFSANPTLSGTANAANLTLSGLLTQSASGIRVGLKDDLSTRVDSGFYETSSATIAEGWPIDTSWMHLITSTHSNTGNYYSMQIAGGFFDQGLYYRNTAGVGSTAWNRLLTDTYTTLKNGTNRTIQIEGETTGVTGRHLLVLGGDGGTGAAGGNIYIAGGAPGGVGTLGPVILGSDGSGTFGNVGIQDGTPTEAVLVVGSAGTGDIYSTLATAGTTNNAVCWDNAGATLLYDCDATPADYAESYPVDEGITYGDIVMTSNDIITQTDGQTVSKLVKAEKGSEHAVIGIVSNNYHDFTSAGSESINPEDNPMPVALSGRVPVKVNLEGGEIEVGDSVILSSEPGVATKATSTGERIGIALESYEGGDDTILVFVDNGMYYAPDFLAFITKGEVELPEGDTIFERLVTLAESFVDGVLKLASAEIQYVKADKVETNELCVGSVCVDEGTFLQMVEKSGGAVHAMEHDPEPEPDEDTATSTDDGADEGETGGGGDTTPEVDDTVTEETSTDTEEDPVSEETIPDETEVIEEEPEAETPPADTEAETTDEVAEEPAPESAE